MASYSIASGAIGVYGKTLVANTVDTITFPGDVTGSIEVSTNGSAALYFTVDGSTPTVGGAATHELLAGAVAARIVQSVEVGTTVVKVISAGTPTYSVAVASMTDVPWFSSQTGTSGSAGGGVPAGVGDKLAVSGQLITTSAGGEVLLTEAQSLQISEQQGDSITIDGDGRLVVTGGIYAMSLVVGFRDDAGETDHGDAAHIRVRLSDYDTPSWGPNVFAAVGGSDRAEAAASGSWVFPEGDTLNFYIGHDGSGSLTLSYVLWIVKIAGDPPPPS